MDLNTAHGVMCPPGLYFSLKHLSTGARQLVQRWKSMRDNILLYKLQALHRSLKTSNKDHDIVIPGPKRYIPPVDVKLLFGYVIAFELVGVTQ